MTEPNKQTGLVRELGAAAATSVVVGTIIGSGIFRVPSTMMAAAGSSTMVYAAWIVGGLLSFFGALTYSELGAMRPEAGGEYVYIRDAYGKLPAFLYGWTWFAIAKPASIATITTGLTDALSALKMFSFLALPVFGISAKFTWSQVVAILATLLISYLNYLGIKKAGLFQLVFTVLKCLMLISIAAIGFGYASGSFSNFGTHTAQHGSGFMIALVAALWAYDGWNDLSMVGGEVKNPQRNIPLALIAGVGICGALYMFMNAAIQYVMSAQQIADVKSPAAEMTRIVLGPGGAAIITAGIAFSLLVTLNGTIMSGSRIPFALARDGSFFPSLARVNPQYATPANSIWIQALCAIVLLLVAATFKELLEIAIFSEWLFYLIAASTIFVFRAKEPDAVRPYKCAGYPIVPALFILSASILLYQTFMENVKNSTICCAIILAGIPVYLWFTRKNRATSSIV